MRIRFQRHLYMKLPKASNFLTSFPNQTDVTHLEKVKSQILTAPNKILPLIERRLEEFGKNC